VLLLGALEPDGQCDLVADGRDACFHAEVGALELAHHNAAAAFLRRRRGRVALEALDRQRDRLGYTEQRQGAFDRLGVVAGKDDTWTCRSSAKNSASCLFADRGSTTRRRAACHHQKVRSLPALRLAGIAHFAIPSP
jgi:hypothetical protein